MSTEATLQLLCGEKKLDRDRGLGELQRLMDECDPPGLERLETALTSLLHGQDSQTSWETRQGVLLGSKVVVMHEWGSETFATQLRLYALHSLNDDEARVRIAAGEVLGALCKRCGTEVYQSACELIHDGVRNNLERIPLSERSEGERENTHILMEKLAVQHEQGGSATAEQIFHDTAGWKNLETWMKCLESVINGCGPHFVPFITQDLLDLIFQTLTHTNRFVRETGYYVMSSLVSCTSPQDNGDDAMESCSELTDESPVLHYGDQVAQHLAEGLADNWSQVRMASSVATRKFLLNLPNCESREKFFPLLLPRMCLNRYYVAEGVRTYSQHTWRQVTGEQGKLFVEANMPNMVDYYIEQTDANNHAVREASCACIAELGSKLNKEVVRPFVGRLLAALLECFSDDSWPVRDAACVACGNFVNCFPEESRPSMEKLYPLFFANLADNIPSVRQGAAVALLNVAKAYGEEASNLLMDKIKEGVSGLETQTATSEKYGDLEKGPATFSVAKRLRDNDIELHSDKQMYSCGSLAPKMGRGSKREGGCMDHKFRRPSEPWEVCEGCIQLLSELSSIQSLSASVGTLLPSVAEATRNQTYAQHVHLLETVCKQLPVIAKNIGKRYFKPNLERFLDSIFYALSCDNALTSSAASLCLIELGKYLGPNILKGRVEQYNPNYINKLLANQCGAPL
ncbi:uncharacterized protein LOC119745577 [Patiria miniata]|uniref:TOG domain-containing protein n=1 Tax=Patiria miniata TaxID=46514 RepID=A0A914BNV8_PATMI|nr:uncharacterized protein LOC119745577 [Patiria miniata]